MKANITYTDNLDKAGNVERRIYLSGIELREFRHKLLHGVDASGAWFCVDPAIPRNLRKAIKSISESLPCPDMRKLKL